MVGIDPGLKGGIAIFNPDRTVSSVHIMPLRCGGVCVKELKRLIASPCPTWVFVEQAFARQYQGLKGTMTMFTNYGRLLAALEDLEVPYEIIPSVEWQKHYGIRGTDGATTKDQSIAICKSIYPDVNLKPHRFMSPHDGLSDAILIGRYGIDTRT